MVAISEAVTYTAEITRVETTDVALGGNEVNVPNKQFKQIADRFAWLKNTVDGLNGGDLAAIEALSGTGYLERTGTNTWQLSLANNDISVAQGRLTLASANPTPTSNITGATTLYYAEYAGNQIALYDGTNWVTRTFSNVSLSLSGLVNARPYDIFASWNGSAVALEALAWTNDSTRATALTRQDGILVRSGLATRRYLGTIYTSATGQCSDTVTQRYVWNNQHRIARNLYIEYAGSTSHTYNSATYRDYNNDSAFKLNFVTGADAEAIWINAQVGAGDGGRCALRLNTSAEFAVATQIDVVGGSVGDIPAVTLSLGQVAGVADGLIIGRNTIALRQNVYNAPNAASFDTIGEDTFISALIQC